MGSPYIGEIRLFAGNFAPAGWMFCDGTVLAISEYTTLFQLIGTTYGGDGQSTFNLPDLRSRVPIHLGTGGGGSFTIGQSAGAELITLTQNQIPAHSHVPQASSETGTLTSPAGAVWASSTNLPYSANAPTAALNAAAIGTTGGSQPHDNMLPYLAINFIISLFGIFPAVN